jgi:hypothetical protein
VTGALQLRPKITESLEQAYSDIIKCAEAVVVSFAQNLASARLGRDPAIESHAVQSDHPVCSRDQELNCVGEVVLQ